MLSPWKFADACVIGSAHERSGLPCQDALLIRELESQRGETCLFAAVADGAGSETQAREAARLACGSMGYLLGRFLDLHEPHEITEELVGQYVQTTTEVFVERANELQSDPQEFACTLVLALVWRGGAIYAQIGDGAIVVTSQASPDDWNWIFWPDKGEFENETVFLRPGCQPVVQFAQTDQRPLELALFTDGVQILALHYATRTVHAPFMETLLAPLRMEAFPGRCLTISNDLATFLASERVDERSSDDKSLILGTRRSWTGGIIPG